jgi:signal transduction protein with GAF and PtsI domain
MPDVRMYRLGDKACVVKVRGDLDAAAVAAVARAAGIPTVIDLLDARLVDLDALDSLVADTDAIFVATRPLHDALELIALHRPVRTASTLAAALR